MQVELRRESDTLVLVLFTVIIRGGGAGGAGGAIAPPKISVGEQCSP